MVKLIARIEAKPGQEALVMEALLALAGPSREEPGCLMYDVCRAKDDPARLYVLEEWESQTDLDEHMQSPHFARFLERGGPGIAGEPAIEFVERL